jgi:hypothetical protein
MQIAAECTSAAHTDPPNGRIRPVANWKSVVRWFCAAGLSEFILFFFGFGEQIASYASFSAREDQSFAENLAAARRWLS